MTNNTPAQVKVFRVLGTTDDITVCDQCGRDDLRSTVVLAELDADGNEIGITYMGSDCGANAAGWTQTRVRAEARAADKARRDAERAAQRAAFDAKTDRETADLIEWAAEVYGVHATTRAEVFAGVQAAAGLRTGTKVLMAFYSYKETAAAADREEAKPVKDWTKMTAADFYTDGVQLDMFTGVEGDGYGTISLDEIAAEAEAPADEFTERADGALFGLAATDGPTADGALFGLVAA